MPGNLRISFAQRNSSSFRKQIIVTFARTNSLRHYYYSFTTVIASFFLRGCNWHSNFPSWLHCLSSNFTDFLRYHEQCEVGFCFQVAYVLVFYQCLHPWKVRHYFAPETVDFVWPSYYSADYYIDSTIPCCLDDALEMVSFRVSNDAQVTCLHPYT